MHYENSPLPPANCTLFLPLHPTRINHENATGLCKMFFPDILLVQSFGGLEGFFVCPPAPYNFSCFMKDWVLCPVLCHNCEWERAKPKTAAMAFLRQCTITTAVYNKEQIWPHQWHDSSGESSLIVNIRRSLFTS